LDGDSAEPLAGQTTLRAHHRHRSQHGQPSVDGPVGRSGSKQSRVAATSASAVSCGRSPDPATRHQAAKERQPHFVALSLKEIAPQFPETRRWVAGQGSDTFGLFGALARRARGLPVSPLSAPSRRSRAIRATDCGPRRILIRNGPKVMDPPADGSN
jgi:hypothetical protein